MRGTKPAGTCDEDKDEDEDDEDDEEEEVEVEENVERTLEEVKVEGKVDSAAGAMGVGECGAVVVGRGVKGEDTVDDGGGGKESFSVWRLRSPGVWLPPPRVALRIVLEKAKFLGCPGTPEGGSVRERPSMPRPASPAVAAVAVAVAAGATPAAPTPAGSGGAPPSRRSNGTRSSGAGKSLYSTTRSLAENAEEDEAEGGSA